MCTVSYVLCVLLVVSFWFVKQSVPRARAFFLFRSVVRKKVLASEEPNCDWALTWWALADIPEPATPKGEFRMSYSTRQAIYYGEVRAVHKCLVGQPACVVSGTIRAPFYLFDILRSALAR